MSAFLLEARQVWSRLPHAAAAVLVVLFLGLSFGSTGCNEFDECQQDSDCGDPNDGWRCVIGESGWVSTNYCAPVGAVVTPPDMTEDMPTETVEGCNFMCDSLPPGVASARCLSDGTSVCEVVCTTGATADCDEDLSNGCEVDITSDADNCGACGNICSDALAGSRTVGECQTSMCVATGCVDEWHDMNGDFSDGCEVGVLTGNIDDRDLQGTSIQLVTRVDDGTAVSRNGNGPTNRSMEFVADDVNDDRTDKETVNLTGEFQELHAHNSILGVTLVVGTTSTQMIAFQSNDNTGGFDVVGTQPFPGYPGALGAATAGGVAEFSYGDGDGATPDSSWIQHLTFARSLGDDCIEPVMDSGVFFCTGPERTLSTTGNYVDVVRLSEEPGSIVLSLQDGGLSYLYADSNTLELLTPPIGAPSLPAQVLEMEPWQDETGVRGVAVMSDTEVVFYEVKRNDMNATRSEIARRTLPTEAQGGDLVPLGRGRFAIVTSNGVHLLSARQGEESFPFIAAQDLTATQFVSSADAAGGVLALVDSTLLLLTPYEFLEDAE